jgi:tricorn protease
MGDLWTTNLEGKDLKRLTANRGRDFAPRFTPDGKTVAFSSDRDGNVDVYIVPSDGGIPKQLTVHPADETVLSFSPDGQSVLFSSQRGEEFMGKLYTVPIAGGAAQPAGPDMGVYASYSPDGQSLAINRRSQSYWRKGYRGAYQSDLTLMDLKSKTFKEWNDWPGMDTWPMWGPDGFIYFVSDRGEGGTINLWRMPAGGGDAQTVTRFTSGEVRFPSLATDGKSIVFEHDFQLYRLELPSGEPRPISVTIAAEPQDDRSERREFNSQVDDYALSPDGRNIVFSIRGEIFTAPTSEGDVSRVTKSADRDRNVEYSPDGKMIAFVSDAPGDREELFVAPADLSSPAHRVTDIDALKESYLWSPDSKKLAFTTGDGKLYTITAEGKDQKELVTSKFGSLRGVDWSPDGAWLAYSRPDVTRSTDIYLTPSDGGEEKKVTFDSASEMGPRFSADAKKLYFIRTSQSFEGASGDRPSVELCKIFLEKQEKDPDDSQEAGNGPGGESGRDETMRRLAEARGAGNGPGGGSGGRPAAAAPPPKAPTIDWAGIKRRTVVVTRAPGMISSFVPGRDSRTLLLVSSEGGASGGGGGGRGLFGGTPSITLISDDGKRSARVTTGAAPPATENEDGPRGGRGGFGGLRNLMLTRDGRTVYYQQGEGVYSASLPSLPPANASAGNSSSSGPQGGGRRGGGGGPGGENPALSALAAASGGSGRRVNFTVRAETDQPAEWLQMFDDAWRCMKYRFYDLKMHGIDWNAVRDRYRPMVSHVGSKAELIDLVNEMIGELNASHTGASIARDRGGDAGPGSAAFRDVVSLGFELEADSSSGRYKVSHVFEDGPADRDWIKVRAGDYLLQIDGKELKSGEDLVAVLAERLNRKVKLTLNDKPESDGSWSVKLEPIGRQAYTNLRYEKWVKERRAMVDKLSNGRIGYLHIRAMDQSSLARFRKDLGENRAKEALVIDQRFNGGGNIEQELLAILVQRPYQVWQPRATEPTKRPFAGFFGPKVVLQNWRSASNAEMFPAGFRALGLGKVIGTPTMGAVIGTGSYSLIDGSSIRTPGVGVFLADDERTNMENTPVQPDILVENSPEDNLAGRDRQVEVAVEELLKQLPGRESPGVGGAGNDNDNN